MDITAQVIAETELQQLRALLVIEMDKIARARQHILEVFPKLEHLWWDEERNGACAFCRPLRTIDAILAGGGNGK